MARSVRVGDFQAMQRRRSGPMTATTEPAVEPLDGEGIDVATAANIPEQLAALEIHATAGSAYADIIKRLRTRCTLLDIQALDEEIAAEARRRCGMLPEAPTAEESDFVDGQTVDDQRPYADEDPEELREPPVEPWPHGTAVVVRIGEHTIEGRYLTTQDHGDGPVLGIELPSVNLNWGIGEAGLHWLSPDQVSLADEPVAPMAEDQVGIDPINARMIADAERAAPDEPTMADELISLDVELLATAEWSLGMIRARVAEMATALDTYPSEDEIAAEADRIWRSFDQNRKGPREYTVEPSGEVRDWRRPDTTPDRGDVTAVHTISDETEQQRFSGAGAEDVPFSEPSKLVPADKDFNGKAYVESTELAALASDLIERHGYLDHLEHCEIRYFWKRKTGSTGRQRVLGGIKRGSDLLGHLLKADFAIFLAADTARERHHADRRVERSLFRQLRRLGQDDKGNFILLPWTMQLFPEEIQEYADLDDEDLKLGRNAYRGAEQMGLFRDDGPEPVADDGAGVLIHADGSPMTADEIAEQEAAELHGEEEDDDEGMADPDGPSPDESDDPLADHDL